MAIRDRGKPGVFAVRDVGTLVTETRESGHELKRAVSATQLTVNITIAPTAALGPKARVRRRVPSCGAAGRAPS